MATLNTSTNGPSISKSYQSIISSPVPSSSAAQSPTYAQWAVFSISTPLVNSFQQDSTGKESVLKVHTSGDGELSELIDEFSDGRVQFAFVKVKDPNTSLPKYVLIGWCGEGVPERTKGYFTSHSAAVGKVLHGYHVQITARSDRDLTPNGIVQKVSDASGSNYSSNSAPTMTGPPPPAIASKPVFTPTQSSRSASGFNPLTIPKPRISVSKNENLDQDGWGTDAPPVTRTQLEKVQSSYQPTKVNMRELSSQKQELSRFADTRGNHTAESSGVVKGDYQPIGKVDIAALRRSAQEKASTVDDRPTIVKGAYEPVGKVDIAAIRARAIGPSEGPTSPPAGLSPNVTGNSTRSSDRGDEQKPFLDRSALLASERLTSLPKPKLTSSFSLSASAFAGTKIPTPIGFGLESKTSPTVAPIGASRTFADEGGKTPAQLWAEKKAREHGNVVTSRQPPLARLGAPASPSVNQASSGGEWKSGYSGKSWAAVQTTKSGQSAEGVDERKTGQQDDYGNGAPEAPSEGAGAIRDRFKESTAAPGFAPSPPPVETSNKPNVNRSVPLPGILTHPTQETQEYPKSSMPTPPPQPPRSPTPPTPVEEDLDSPIRIAVPVTRGHEPEINDAHEEQFSPPPPMPVRSIIQNVVAQEDSAEDLEPHDPVRYASMSVAATSFGQHAVDAAHPGATESGKRALVLYDYEKAEDNEVEMKEGEYITNIEMVDEDWWMGTNPHSETGLFPSNYVELVESEGAVPPEPEIARMDLSESALPAGPTGGHTIAGPVADALYDYEAAEDNELSFPEGAKITNIQFPDDDWWSGEYNGKEGLFPANYVQLEE